ncbi:glycosyltransferase [Noviherbaspirillum massiliense]|uniref:glycosyltransferase n=1 Tax=Noviherbaspirillum massiliense TaxID=1465823 RepID=UPI00030A7A59|nr:glycosyltransferase [Noviherbaspirillum massiliense]
MFEGIVFALASASLLAWIVLTLWHGSFWRIRFPRPCAEPRRWPTVVAIVPARDEADVIDATLEGLLQQEYPGAFHVILVDDHSTDGTASVAAAAAKKLSQEARLTIVTARDLPAGWVGKVWAQSEGLAVQQQNFPEARYVLLTDADIGHDRQALRRLVARAEAEQRVLTSLMVRLQCASPAEKALIPAFVFFFTMLYPFSRVNDPCSRVAAAAGGCMLARVDTLMEIGGFAAIKDALIDDCALARHMKRHGPIRLDLAQDSYSLRSYGSWSGVWNMIARSAYTQLRYSPWLLAGTALGMLLMYMVPPALTLGLTFTGSYPVWPALLAWLIMSVIYTPMLRYYRQSLLWAPALPLVAMFYLGATVASAWRYWRGRGGQWKQRSQAIRQPPYLR